MTLHRATGQHLLSSDEISKTKYDELEQPEVMRKGPQSVRYYKFRQSLLTSRIDEKLLI